MAARKIRGTGITKRHVNVLGGTAEEIDETLGAVAERRGFEGKVVEIEPMATEILIEAGYDPKNVRLRVTEDDTPAEYAYEILNRIRQVRSDIANGRADDAARWALELGYLCCEFAMKLELEKPALLGLAKLASLARGREMAFGSPSAKQRRWDRQCAAFDAARERGLNKMAAYEAAARQCGVGSKTVQRSVKRREKESLDSF